MSSQILAVERGATIAAATPASVHAQSLRDVEVSLDTVQFAAALDVKLAASNASRAAFTLAT